MADRGDRALGLAAAYGALSGVRTTGAPFALSRRSSGAAGRLTAVLRSPPGRRLLAGCALAEGVVDKMPWIPPRTDAAPLAGRVVVGAVVGAAIAEEVGGSRIVFAVVGGAAAAASAFLATRLRRRLTRAFVPDLAVGLAEDAVVVCGAYALRGSGAG